MTEEEVQINDHYIRGIWMLEQQIHSVEDLVHFWKIFGSVREEIPSLELRPNWDVV